MRSPCPVEWNQTSGVHSTTKDILREEFPFIPSNSLFLSISVFTFPNNLEPLMISIVAVTVLQPFVNERIR